MREISGRTILERVIARLKPQCGRAHSQRNGDPARFAAFGLPVIADTVENFPGPLAGILAALDWAAANRPDVSWILSAAADCPFYRATSWRACIARAPNRTRSLRSPPPTASRTR